MSKYTEKQLSDARIYAAKNSRALAAEALTADYYADHVDLKQRMDIKERWTKWADEVEAGKHDGNMTVSQGMIYFLTGECPALLP